VPGAPEYFEVSKGIEQTDLAMIGGPAPRWPSWVRWIYS
jgi:hypothetical protein